MVGEAKKTLSEAEIAALVTKEIANIDGGLKEIQATIDNLAESLKAITALQKADFAALGKLEGEFQDLSPWETHVGKEGTVNHLEQIERINSKKPKNSSKPIIDIDDLKVQLNSKRKEIRLHRAKEKDIKPVERAQWEKDLNTLNSQESGLRAGIKISIMESIQDEIASLAIIRNQLLLDQKKSNQIKELEKKPLTPGIIAKVQTLKDEIALHASTRVDYKLEVERNIIQNNIKTLNKAKANYTADLTLAQSLGANIAANREKISTLEKEIKVFQKKIAKQYKETESQIQTIKNMVRDKLEADKPMEMDESDIPVPPPLELGGPPGPPPLMEPQSYGYTPGAKKEGKEETKPDAATVKNAFLGEINPDSAKKLRPTVKVENPSKQPQVINLKEGLKSINTAESKDDKGLKLESLFKPKIESKDSHYKTIEASHSAVQTIQSNKRELITKLEKKAKALVNEQHKQPIYKQIVVLQKESIASLEALKREYRLQLEEIQNKNEEFLKIINSLESGPAVEENLPPPPPPPPGPPSFDLFEQPKSTANEPSAVSADGAQKGPKKASSNLDVATTQQAFAKGAETKLRGFLALQVIRIIEQKGADKDSDFQKKLLEILPELTAEKMELIGPLDVLDTVKEILGKKPYEHMSETERVRLIVLLAPFLTKHEKYPELMEFTGTEKIKEEERQEVFEAEKLKSIQKILKELDDEQQALAREKQAAKLSQIVTLNPLVDEAEIKAAESELDKAKVGNPSLGVFKQELEENRKKFELLSLAPEISESISKIIAEASPPPPPEAPGKGVEPEVPKLPEQKVVMPKSSTVIASQGFFAHHKPHHSSDSKPSFKPLPENSSQKDREDWLKQYYFGNQSLETSIEVIGNKLLEKGEKGLAQLLYKLAVTSRGAKDHFIHSGDTDKFVNQYESVIKLISERKSDTGPLAWIKKVFQNIVDSLTGKAGLKKEMQEVILQKLHKEYEIISSVSIAPAPDSPAPPLTPKG